MGSNKLKIVLLSITLLFLVGCKDEVVYEGVVTDIEFYQGGWSAPPRTKIIFENDRIFIVDNIIFNVQLNKRYVLYQNFRGYELVRILFLVNDNDKTTTLGFG